MPKSSLLTTCIVIYLFINKLPEHCKKHHLALCRCMQVTTHSQLRDDAKLAAGVYLNLLCLSLEIESTDDIKADLEEAFKTL